MTTLLCGNQNRQMRKYNWGYRGTSEWDEQVVIVQQVEGFYQAG